MNICILGAHLPPVMGGIEVHMWGLAENLVKKGHRVFLIGSAEKGGNSPLYEKKDGIEIFRIRYIPGLRRLSRGIGVISKVLQLHFKYGVDIMHCHYFYPIGVTGVVIRLLTGIPVVVTEHGSIIIDQYSFIRRNILKLSSKLVKKIIVPSIELYNILKNIDIKETKLLEIPNCVETDAFSPKKHSGKKIRQELNIYEDEKVILALRRIVPKTGIQYLVEAAKYIVKKDRKVKFMIVGKVVSESFYQKLINRIEELGLTDYFIFVGSVDNSRVPEYIAASDISVFPSLAEATSIACLEIMSMGKPVVATDVGGLPEIISDNKTGYLVDFGQQVSSYDDWQVEEKYIKQMADQILYLIKNDNLRDEMGENARQSVVENFSWKRYIKIVEKEYIN